MKKFFKLFLCAFVAIFTFVAVGTTAHAEGEVQTIEGSNRVWTFSNMPSGDVKPLEGSTYYSIIFGNPGSGSNKTKLNSSGLRMYLNSTMYVPVTANKAGTFTFTTTTGSAGRALYILDRDVDTIENSTFAEYSGQGTYKIEYTKDQILVKDGLSYIKLYNYTTKSGDSSCSIQITTMSVESFTPSILFQHQTEINNSKLVRFVCTINDLIDTKNADLIFDLTMTTDGVNSQPNPQVIKTVYKQITDKNGTVTNAGADYKYYAVMIIDFTGLSGTVTGTATLTLYGVNYTGTLNSFDI